ncbi:hypothetical protein E2C01_044094 [Portunus trituberculatus]|uniref:Uncharacterized protein n=1 Tax=Portunus trituberculatus TaxID=210409 RepID=A0A5B7FS83_PORTR|nr:hypothetical protein [Portunus trituberculatus]
MEKEGTPRPLNSSDRKKGKDLRAGREGGGSDLGTGATWQCSAFLGIDFLGVSECVPPPPRFDWPLRQVVDCSVITLA